MLAVIADPPICELQMILMLQRVYWKPDVVPSTGPDHLFSEARALKHLHVLAEEIGNRQVRRQADHAMIETVIMTSLAPLMQFM